MQKLPVIARIFILAAAWIYTAYWSKICITDSRGPAPDYRLPKWLSTVFFGWVKSESYNVLGIVLQFGIYLLFILYVFGECVGLTERLPEKLHIYIIAITYGLFLAGCGVFGILQLIYSIKYPIPPRRRRPRKPRDDLRL